MKQEKSHNVELSQFLETLEQKMDHYFKYLNYNDPEYIVQFSVATLLSPLHSFSLDDPEVAAAKKHLKLMYMEKFGNEFRSEEANDQEGGLLSDFPLLNDRLMQEEVEEQESEAFETDYIEYRRQARAELAKHRGDKNRSKCPSVFWRMKDTRIGQIARSLMAIFPTSTSCERLFSISSQLCSLRRNRITPKHLEQRVILRLNMDLLD